MKKSPQVERVEDLARKGVHAGLRSIALAPEQVRARALRAEARNLIGVTNGPRVLFLTPRSWAVHVQLETMLAHALHLRGADVSFVTCGGGLDLCDRCNTYEAPPMPCRSCRKYTHDSIDAHGFARQAMADNWVGDGDDGWPELDGLGLDALLTVQWEGLPLGRLIDIPVRWFLLRSSLDDEPLAALTARRLLRSARRIARSLEAILDHERPDVLVVLNGLFLFESVARALADRRAIDTVAYERGFILNTWIFFRRPSSQMHDVTDAWQAWQSVPLTDAETRVLDDYLVDRKYGRKTIYLSWKGVTPQPVAPARTGRRVLLFTNLTWDSAVLGKEVAFPSIHAWLRTTIEFFRIHPNDELIIRIHPSEVKMPGKRTREPLGMFVDHAFPDLPPNVRVVQPEDATSSYSLMDTADVGLVYTSTAGLELALQGIPTLVAGRVHYRGKGFTVDVESPQEFTERLQDVLDEPSRFAPEIEAARRYAYLFFFRAALTVPGVDEHRIGLVRLTLDGLDDLRPGRDAELDRLCDGILQGAGFVSMPSSTP